MKKILSIIVLGLLLTGCIPKVSPTGGSYSGIKIEPDKSRIIILRRGDSLISMDTPAVRISGTTGSSYFLPSKGTLAPGPQENRRGNAKDKIMNACLGYGGVFQWFVFLWDSSSMGIVLT